MYYKTLRSLFSSTQLRFFSHSQASTVNVLSHDVNHLGLNDPTGKAKLITNLVKRLDLSHEEAETRVNYLDNLAKKWKSENTEDSITKLSKAIEEIPNQTHPDVLNLTEPKVLQPCPKWQHNLTKIRPFDEIAKTVSGVRWENLVLTATDKSYYLLGDLAELEQALIRYTVATLTKEFGFQLISVPDLLDPQILKQCGMETDGPITQVFRLDRRYHKDTALSGTAEMALGGFFKNKTVLFPNPSDPVERLAAVSRCFRAESTRGLAGNGIYRVHHFTKVEMFAVTENNLELSSKVHEEFLAIQKKLFGDLGLSFQVLDMPPNDLGSPAYRKFDIEVLLPGRVHKPLGSEYAFGEISSTSNCTDYQSRRLNIRTSNGNFAHTVNGTACAVPRMIMAICEQFQVHHGCVKIPKVLLPYFSTPKTDGLMKSKPKSKRVVFKYIRSPKYFKSKFLEQQKVKESEKPV